MRRSKRPLLLSLAIASFAIAAIALVRNVLSTMSTISDYGYPSSAFWPIFFSTEGATGVDVRFVFFVWGPFVFGGLGIALLAAHLVVRAMRAGAPVVVGGGAPAATQGWQQPQQGWQPTPDGGQPGPQQGWQPTPQATDGTEPGSAQQSWSAAPPPPRAEDRIQP